jgi:tetratricopeptide (TPR) repeat protein
MRYRAFVSSTYEDLREHRAFAIRALRQAGFDVDPMENWPSAAGEPRVLSLDQVEECDILILLVAMRRGYIPHGRDRSITQLEYDHAIEQGVDVLAFLLDDGSEWPERWRELERDPGVADWRQELCSHHTVQFFGERPESVELAASLTRWLRERYAHNVPHQLPRPPEDFTGREVEIDELVRQLGGGGASISGIRGLGGIGKTSLALTVANRVRRRFRDGQIYLDLKGTTEPLPPSAAMLHVIRALRREEETPHDEAQVEGLYHSVLSGRNVLLLMDNAAGKEQVQSLVPADGSAMLVTSRQHFVLPGLAAINLNEMHSEDAERLLISIAPRVGAQAGRIADLCGGLPLALRLAGNALATRPDLSPADYGQRLVNERQRIAQLDRADVSHGVNASLSLSYQMLERDLRARMPVLAVFPADFDSTAAAAVWGVDLQTTDDLLGSLLRSSLLEWRESSGGRGRYRFHDLVRLFASQQLDDSERKRASGRHAEHYLGVLGDAAQQYRTGGEGVARGLGLFDLEWENIRAGFRWCEGHAGESDAAAALCGSYPARGAEILQLRQHRGDRISWFESGLAHAGRLEDRGVEVTLLGHLGVAFGNVGELSRAIACHEQSLAIVREIGDRAGEGVTLENLGEAHWRRGQSRQSIACYEQSLAIAREIGDSRREGNCLVNMAHAYWQLGEPRQAIEVAERCLEVACKTGDRQKEGQSLAIIGVSWKELGEPERCLELSAQQLEIAREMGDRFSEGTSQTLLGIAHRSVGEIEAAVECFEEALRILRDIGDRFFEGEASFELGLAFEKAGELERAKAAMEVRLDYRRSTGHPGVDMDATRIAELEKRISNR